MFECRSLAAALLLLAGPVAGQARTVPEAWADGETRAYVFRTEEAEFGTSWIRHVGLDDGLHRFVLLLDYAGSRIGVPPDYRADADLWIDPTGRPRRIRLRTRLPGIEQDLALEYGDRVTGQIVVGTGGGEGAADAIDASYPAGSPLIARNLIGLLDLFLSLGRFEDDGARRTRFFDTNRLVALDYRIERRGTEIVGGQECVVGADSLGQKIWILPSGKLARIMLSGGKITIEAAEVAWPEWRLAGVAGRTPESAGPAGVLSEEVRVSSDGAVLAATLARPTGGGRSLPAVVFVSDAGPHDRRARTAGLDLATGRIVDRLARRFVVLHLDDRGTGGSSGDFLDAGLDDLVVDAAAAVVFLRRRPDVDETRIAIVGHGEGGVIAPILAARDQRLAAIALLAAPARPIDQVMADRTAALLRREGRTEEEIEVALEGQRRQFARLRAGEAIAGLSRAEWITDHLVHDPVATIGEVECPVWIAIGDRDSQISVDDDARVLAGALDGPGSDVELRVFEDLDHVFEPGDRPGAIAPEFLDALEDWLGRRLGG